MGKTYLLTGATGFLGSLLSLKLVDAGHKVILLGRTKNGVSFQKRAEKKLRSLKNNISFDNIGFLEVDLSKKNLGLSAQTTNMFQNKVDALWHLAADLSFKTTNKNRIFSTNIQGLKNVLNFTGKINAPIYYVSTAYVHGKRDGIIFEKDLVRPKKFNNPYEESKFEAEKIIRERGRKKKNKFIVFRPGILIQKTGKNANFFGYYVVVSSLYKLGRILLFLPYNKKIKAYLMPVETAVEWMIEIGNNSQSISKTFHITNPKPFPIKDVVKQTFDATNSRVLLFPAPVSFARFYFSLFCFLGKFLPPLKKLAQKFYYYKYYMTETRTYDMSNTKKIIGEEKIKKLDFEDDFIKTVATKFIKNKLS